MSSPMIPINTSVVSGVALSRFGTETKMLLLKRSKEGYWCHVAGKIETGETGWQAIIREFDEETQIQVTRLYSCDYLEQFYEPHQNQILIIPTFVVICEPQQTVTLNPEHTDYRWCGLEEAKQLVPFPNQRSLYEHVWQHFVIRQPSPHMRVTGNE